jgi:DNA-binding response OmpR family regulator
VKLLVVDDDRDLVELLDYALRREGYDVVRAYDGESAVEAVGRGTSVPFPLPKARQLAEAAGA